MMSSVSDMKNIWKMNPCQVCQLEFPGPVLLRRHMQVKHKSETTSFARAEKRKSPFPDGSVSLKQRLDEISKNSSKDLVQANVGQSSSPTLFEKIEQFEASNNHAAETAFNATFTRRDPVAKTERQSTPVAKEGLKCNYCEFQARSATGLTRHTTGHTGARKCSKCKKGYAQGSSSSEHYLKRHEASCTGEHQWLAVSGDNQEAASTPPVVRNERENQTVPDIKTEYSDQPPQLSLQVKSEDLKPTPVVLKEEEVSPRNIKFEAYISSQTLNNGLEQKPIVPLYIYNKPILPQKPLQPLLPKPIQHQQPLKPLLPQPLQPLQPQPLEPLEPLQHIQPKQAIQPQPIPPLQPLQQPDDSLNVTSPENKKKPQERNQFGPKGKLV